MSSILEQSSSLDLRAAAARANCHPDTMRRLMKAGQAPGIKVGRSWVVSASVFQEWLDNKCRRSINAKARTDGGSEFPSLAERLAARRVRRTGSKRRNSSSVNETGNGGFTGSGTVVPFDGKRRRLDT
ncbi:MAG: helix-turn-helix domain-containing protein [Terriglobales bacterium]